uniref:Uncharacterized protein n=1 Tax=Aegilops tauschii TaxID=37682 RepID=M8C4C9_AEGTA
MVGTTRGDAAKGMRRVATSSRHCEAANAATVVTVCWNHWRQCLCRTVLGTPLVATAALFLASKTEETTCLLNTILRASCEVSENQEFNLLPYMSRGQNWFELYRESVIQAEQMILTTLDFELEVAHPYTSLSSALSRLGLSHSVLFNVALSLINEGLGALDVVFLNW